MIDYTTPYLDRITDEEILAWDKAFPVLVDQVAGNVDYSDIWADRWQK